MGNSIYTPDPIVSTPHVEFDILNPTPDMVVLEDMVISLAREFRYTNLSSHPVAVLTHLHLCDAIANDMGLDDPQLRLLILLHDAHEYVMKDLCRPMKRLINDRADGLLTDIETGVDAAIFEKFGLDLDLVRHDHPLREQVKVVDNLALAHEVHACFPQVLDRWSQLPEIDTDGELHRAARVLFMQVPIETQYHGFISRLSVLMDKAHGLTHNVTGNA